jgi:hypothetical protein
MSTTKFTYKGTSITDLVTSGNSTISTTYYKGFPPFSKGTDDYSTIKNKLLYEINGTDVIDNQIMATSKKHTTSSPISIPTWCNGVKFYISSSKGTKGAKGAKGGAGPAGPAGAKGAAGPGGSVRPCPAQESQVTRQKQGGQGGAGGPGGPGGAGGDGGDGGEGGQGVYMFTTELITVGTAKTIDVTSATNSSLKLGNSNYTSNAGKTGGAGTAGGTGKIGGAGNAGDEGNAGTQNQCQGGNGTTGADGKTGDTGETGSAGTAGTEGTDGEAQCPTNFTIGNSDTASVTIYYFAT